MRAEHNLSFHPLLADGGGDRLQGRFVLNLSETVGASFFWKAA
jgi:hypothetical protein